MKMTFKRFLEDLGSLDGLALALKIAKDLVISRQDAEILANWVHSNGQKADFWSMSDEAVQRVLDAFELEHVGPMDMDKLMDAVQKTYHIPYDMGDSFADL
jgi:hypothetical protein